MFKISPNTMKKTPKSIDIVSILKPFIYFSNLLKLNPIIIKNDNLFISKTLYLFHVLLAAMVGGVELVYFFLDFTQRSDILNPFYIISSLKYVYSQLLFIFYTVDTVLKHRKFVEILEKVDVMLVRMEFDKTELFKLRKYVLFQVFFMVLLCFLTWISVFRRNLNFPHSILFYLMFTYCCIFAWATVLEYLNMFLFAKFCLEKLHTRLKSLFAFKCTSDSLW